MTFAKPAFLHSLLGTEAGSRLAKSAIRALMVFLIALLAHALLSPHHLTVEIEMRSATNGHGELYYAGKGSPFEQRHWVPFRLSSDSKWHTYEVEIPASEAVEMLRIDPGTVEGQVAFRRITIRDELKSTTLQGGSLRRAADIAHNMKRLPTVNDELRLWSRGDDPYQHFVLPPRAGVSSPAAMVLGALKRSLPYGALWLVVDLLVTLAIVRARRSPAIRRLFARAADALSDDGVLRVDGKVVAILIATALCSVIYVALDLNQSALGLWEKLYPDKPVEQLVDLGLPKWIRSDEWNTQSPWLIGYVEGKKAEVDESIGGEKAPLVASVPMMAHVSAIPLVRFYGFHLFDVETGFSFMWAYKSFALLVSFFWLLMILTRGDSMSAALGTAWVYASSFTQWWFSSGLPEILSAFAFTTIAAIYMLFATRKVFVAFAGVLFTYGVVNLALHLYPPFILPLAYLGVALIAGILFQAEWRSRVRTILPFKLGTLAASVLLIVSFIAVYVHDAWDTMQVMMHTVYPGRRISRSGAIPLSKLFQGFFESFRFEEQLFPKSTANACEAGNFVLLAPLVPFVVPFRKLYRDSGALILALCAYCVMVVCWMSVPLPKPIERVMQGLGWALAKPSRSVVGLGVASIILVTLLFSRVRRNDIELRLPSNRMLVPLFTLSLLLVFGWGLRNLDGNFFTWQVVLSGSIATSLMALGAAFGKIRPFVVGLGFAAIAPLNANPLMSGISSLTEKPVLVAAERVGSAREDRWVVIGNRLLSQGLKAKGLTVLTGSQMVPNKKLAAVLDPHGTYEAIWNRYAHVVMQSDPYAPAARYAHERVDLYDIWLNVCGPELRKLKVTRLAFTEPASDSDLRCLEQLPSPKDSGVEFYRFKPGVGVLPPIPFPYLNPPRQKMEARLRGPLSAPEARWPRPKVLR